MARTNKKDAAMSPATPAALSPAVLALIGLIQTEASAATTYGTLQATVASDQATVTADQAQLDTDTTAMTASLPRADENVPEKRRPSCLWIVIVTATLFNRGSADGVAA